VIEVLQLVAKLSVLVFVVTSMVTMGLSLKLREILAPLRKVRLVLLALVANFLLAPLVAYLLAALIPLDRSHAIGLLLLGGAAGAPFLPKLAELARGDLAFSVTLTILLMVGSAIFMPLALPLLIPGLQADLWSIGQPLVVQMILPLAAGLLVKSRSERFASWLKPILSMVSNVSLVLLTALLIGLNVEALLGTLGSGALFASALLVGFTFAAGFLLGGPAAATRRVLGLGTGQRNIAAALVIATNTSSDPQVVIMLLVATIVGLILLLIAAYFFRSGSWKKKEVSRLEQLQETHKDP
jgi:bile acid:Na+ symporter, BASS family